MGYPELTAEKKAQLQDWLNGVLRPWAGEIARVNNHGQAVDEAYNSHVSAILGELADADEIPNESDLAGSTQLTKAKVVSILAHIQGILTSYNDSAHRGLWTQACGAGNMIG